jgi:hypothetical protein
MKIWWLLIEDMVVADSFLETCPVETVSFTTVETRDTLLIPPGYIHAVFTVEDTIEFGGNFFDIYSMDIHLKITDMEDHLNIAKHQRCPYFAEVCLVTVSYFLQTIVLIFLSSMNNVFCP